MTNFNANTLNTDLNSVYKFVNEKQSPPLFVINTNSSSLSYCQDNLNSTVKVSLSPPTSSFPVNFSFCNDLNLNKNLKNCLIEISSDSSLDDFKVDITESKLKNFIKKNDNKSMESVTNSNLLNKNKSIEKKECIIDKKENSLESVILNDSFCNCLKQQSKGLLCNCGEEDTFFDWTWDISTKSTSAELNENCRNVKFHISYSTGTACIRGSKPMTDGQYFWEIKMITPVYGTDMMVGIGTDAVNTNSYRFNFCSMLGKDSESWGLSYYGKYQHQGLFKTMNGIKFGHGSIIGLHLDMWMGNLYLYKNRTFIGTLFNGLRGKLLYPLVSSTAARTGMKLIKACSYSTTLTFLCCNVLRKCIPPHLSLSDALFLPPGLRDFLTNNLSWLVRPSEFVRANNNLSSANQTITIENNKKDNNFISKRSFNKLKTLSSDGLSKNIINLKGNKDNKEILQKYKINTSTNHKDITSVKDKNQEEIPLCSSNCKSSQINSFEFNSESIENSSFFSDMNTMNESLNKYAQNNTEISLISNKNISYDQWQIYTNTSNHNSCNSLTNSLISTPSTSFSSIHKEHEDEKPLNTEFLSVNSLNFDDNDNVINSKRLKLSHDSNSKY